MGQSGIIAPSLRLARRGLTLLAALCFVVSGMASIHTAHALSGGHDAAHAMPAAAAEAHCEPQNKPASETKQDGKFSCCAFACAPLLVLNQAPGLLLVAVHGEGVLPPPQRLVLSQDPDGLFRPPRQNA